MEEIVSKSVYFIAVTAIIFVFFAAVMFGMFPGLSLWSSQEIEFSVSSLANYINSAKTSSTTTSQGVAGLAYPEDAFLIQLFFSPSDYETYMSKFEEVDPDIENCIGHMSICIGRYVNFGCTGQYSDDPTPPLDCPCTIGWPTCDECEDRTTCSPEPSDSNHCLEWEECDGVWEEYPTWVSTLSFDPSAERYFSDSDKFFWYKSPSSISFFQSITGDFLDGSEVSTDEFIIALDCRPINTNVPLVVHDDVCSTTDDSCSSNPFLWAHSTDMVKINNIVFRGSENLIIMTRYDVQ